MSSSSEMIVNYKNKRGTMKTICVQVSRCIDCDMVLC